VHAQQILVMDQGMIVERGTHEELLSMQGKYAEIWYLQQKEAKERE
jgi:ATP-binding cassette subfamily B protein